MQNTGYLKMYPELELLLFFFNEKIVDGSHGVTPFLTVCIVIQFEIAKGFVLKQQHTPSYLSSMCVWRWVTWGY